MGPETQQELIDIQVAREAAADRRLQFVQMVHEKYNVTTAVTISIEHETGLVCELGKATNVLAVLDDEDQDRVRELPTDESFVERIKAMIASVRIAAQKKGTTG